MANTQLKTLLDIFNNSIFRVPDYQRGYAWSETQLNDFWEDLQNLRDEQYHYTGLLTVEEVKPEVAFRIEKWRDDLWMLHKGSRAYYIVDGQQRLTTVVILLKVIFDRFGDEDLINFDRKTDLVRKFLYQEASEFKSYVFGYEKDNPSDEYFKTDILGQTSLLSGVPERTLYTANLEAAKKFFQTKIENIPADELQRLYKKLVTNLKFNYYEIDNDLDVFVAFEVMNNRGKPLSTLELLKNRLIYLTTLLPDDEDPRRKLRDGINEVWKTIYEYLGKNKDNPLDDDEFLWSHWVVYFRYERGEAEAYKTFLLNKYFIAKNVVSKDSEEPISLKSIKEYIDSLSECVKNWFAIYNPHLSSLSAEPKEWLGKLGRIGFGAFAPLIMAAMKYEKDDNFVNLLESCEKFVFLVFRITRRQANTQNNHFYRKASDLYWGRMSISEISDDVQGLTDTKDGWYDFEKFNDYLQEQFQREAGFYSWNGLRYLLFEYELKLQTDANGPSKVSWEQVEAQDSIEHIYPQDAEDEYWKDRFPLSNGENNALHSLGNLLLLAKSKNSQLQNRDFDYKKKHKRKLGGLEVGYFNGSYSEIEVAQCQEWTPKQILERGIKILEFMEQRWNIEIQDKPRVLALNAPSA